MSSVSKIKLFTSFLINRPELLQLNSSTFATSDSSIPSSSSGRWHLISVSNGSSLIHFTSQSQLKGFPSSESCFKVSNTPDEFKLLKLHPLKLSSSIAKAVSSSKASAWNVDKFLQPSKLTRRNRGIPASAFASTSPKYGKSSITSSSRFRKCARAWALR